MSSEGRSKFSNFEKKEFVYSTIQGHAIMVSVLWPRKLRPQQAEQLPVMVYFHGGGHVMGDRLYEPWWSDWLIELAQSEDAMIVTPDYRLIPEASAGEMKEDIFNFWDWYMHSLSSISQKDQWPVRPNLNRLLCVGQSAGGIPAVQSALLRPDLKVKSVIAMYAPLHEESFMNAPRTEKFWGLVPPPPRQAELIIRSYMRRTKGKIRTSGDPLEFGELAACFYRQGWYKRLRVTGTGPGQVYDTLEVLKDSKGLPPTWLIHGDEDSVVSTRCTTEFVKYYREMFSDTTSLHVSIQPGDHVFDVSMSADEAWISDGLELILDYW